MSTLTSGKFKICFKRSKDLKCFWFRNEWNDSKILADDRGLDFDEEVSKRHLDDDSANFNQNISQTVQRYFKKQGTAGHTLDFNYKKYSIL